MQFFPEWSKGLPKITEAEKTCLDVVRRRYLYHCGEGDLLEGDSYLVGGVSLTSDRSI
ncbi:hypothetical protein [Nostoc sp.]|uniref:hypothetical protein n=1 Tax=Nostoc sp. TaxID=1180 RepID=UPI002FF5C6C9